MGYKERHCEMYIKNGILTMFDTRYPTVNTAAAVLPRLPRDRTDWQLLPSLFQDITSTHVATGDAREKFVELFRGDGNHLCSTGFDIKSDGFTLNILITSFAIIS